MTSNVCQLVQQSEAGWIVSLGDGVQPESGGRDVSGTRSSYSGGVGTESQRVGLGLDEPAHAPPVIAEGASCKVVFDGVLYNRAELSNHFTGSSEPAANDADLVLQAYLRWGEDVVHKVKGIFALLIWDERRDVLLCARDPLGYYPLFYAEAGRELLFSTSIEALIRHSRVSDKVNRAALASRLCAFYPAQLEETYFEAVSRVPQGHVLRVNGTRSRHQYRYWNPVDLDGEIDWIGEDELDRFDELLEQATDRYLQLGRPAIFLSGGLDSVSVAAVAVDRSRHKGLPEPRALSLLFPRETENGLEEGPIQRGVASSLDIPGEQVTLDEALGSRGVWSTLLEASGELSAPAFNPWYSAYEHLRLRAKSQGCQTVITGSGGDEWLTVDPYYTADLLRNLDIKGFYRLCNSYRRSYEQRHSHLRSVWNMFWQCGARPLLGTGALRVLPRPAALGILKRRRRRIIPQHVPDWIAPDPVLRRELYQRYEQVPYRQLNPRSFYLGWDRCATSAILHTIEMEEAFETWRRTGVRQLMPYFDADLVEFLYRTPPELLNRGGRTKGLVRQTVARRFPGLGLGQQKKTFVSSFYKDSLREEGPHLWQKMGGAQALAEIDVVDTPTVNSAMSALFSGGQSRGVWRIRELLNTEAWLRSRL